MIGVKYNKNGGIVSVKIQIDAPSMHWTLVFQQSNSANDQTFKKNHNDGSSFTFDLGLHGDLINEVDTWSIGIVNIGSDDQTYSISLTWFQDGNALSEKWFFSKLLSAGKVSNPTDSAMLFNF